ncbi:hypothetical protein P5V15_009263 [Pogonomyrmex californicus]
MRILRWRLKLEEYEYDVIYKAKKINVNADALSRNPVDFEETECKVINKDLLNPNDSKDAAKIAEMLELELEQSDEEENKNCELYLSDDDKTEDALPDDDLFGDNVDSILFTQEEIDESPTQVTETALSDIHLNTVQLDTSQMDTIFWTRFNWTPCKWTPFIWTPCKCTPLLKQIANAHCSFGHRANAHCSFGHRADAYRSFEHRAAAYRSLDAHHYLVTKEHVMKK